MASLFIKSIKEDKSLTLIHILFVMYILIHGLSMCDIIISLNNSKWAKADRKNTIASAVKRNSNSGD